MSLVDRHHRLTNKNVQCQKRIASFGAVVLNLPLYIDSILYTYLNSYTKRNEPISFLTFRTLT